MDRYLEFVAARARPNTVLATGYDLKGFFSIVAKDPAEVTTADVLDFITVQRGDRRVVRLADGESGLSARTIQRRLSSISGLFGFLVACLEGFSGVLEAAAGHEVALGAEHNDGVQVLVRIDSDDDGRHGLVLLCGGCCWISEEGSATSSM
ncbi:MAG TPA: site-specific integrase, partial [Cryptosporangiaceae bacterium]|nr:site-specific integrase [Cryptosporangiaceae bacterium]